MNTEQFNELVSIVAQLNENSFSWSSFLADIGVTIIGAGVAAYVAFKVAEQQIDSSEKLQEKQRIKEFNQQTKYRKEDNKRQEEQRIRDINQQNKYREEEIKN